MFPTYNLGYTLDMIATEITQNRNVTAIQGPYISDFLLIAIQLRNLKNIINEIEYRRLTDEAIQEFLEQVQQPTNPRCKNA